MLDRPVRGQQSAIWTHRGVDSGPVDSSIVVVMSLFSAWPLHCHHAGQSNLAACFKDLEKDSWTAIRKFTCLHFAYIDNFVVFCIRHIYYKISVSPISTVQNKYRICNVLDGFRYSGVVSE